MTSAVPKKRRIALVGLSVATLVGAAALSGVVATTSSAATGDKVYDDIITIKTTSRGGTVTQYNGTDSPTVQDFASSKPGCALTPPTAGPITFGGSGTVGFNSGSIGIIEKSGSGQACGQVNYLSPTEESLTIDLNGSTANVAALDMEVQKDARVLARTYQSDANGDPISGSVRTFELLSGASVNADPTPGVEQVFICNVATSSAPNSNITDNCRWLFGGVAPFDVVELRALRGQFSLEGGADGTVPKAAGEPSGVPANVSYFKLGELCTSENRTTVIGSAEGGATGLPTGSVKRYTNADGSICFDDELETTVVNGSTVDIIKKGQPYAQYVARVDWKKSPTTAAVKSNAVSQTTIQFSIGPNPEDLSPETVLPWCPMSLFDPTTSAAGDPAPIGSTTSGDRYLTLPSSVTSGGLTAAELTTYNITNMAGPSSPSVQFACILDRDVNYSAGTFVVSDVIYVLGDLRFRS